MGRVLAIDFGTKRSGLAVTDPLRLIANGLETVATHKLMEYLNEYVKKEGVDTFVVGLPLQENGGLSANAIHVKAFRKKLQNSFPSIPIFQVDERFTSKMAFQTLIDSGVTRKKRREKGVIDKISAILILQTYLETLEFKSDTDKNKP